MHCQNLTKEWFMKRVKIVGVAIAAAACLAACTGVGTAAATVLCSTNTNPCTGTKYGVGTVIQGHLKGGTESVTTAGFATVKMANSEIEMKVTNAGSSGETVIGNNIKIVETNGNCTVTTILLGAAEIHYSFFGNGTKTWKSMLVTKSCSGISCNFGAAATGTTIGTITGGSPATLKVEAKLPYSTGDASSFVCTLGSGTASWVATYELTSPSALYIAGS
jgi:hypothetical protein